LAKSRQAQSAEVIENGRGRKHLSVSTKKIAKQVGMQNFRELLNIQVNRGTLLAIERTRHHRRELLGLYAPTYNSTDEKTNILLDVCEELGQPQGFLQVEVVE
jgi:hypothetical protein